MLAEPIFVPGTFADGTIATEPSTEAIRDMVMGGEIVVVKNVFAGEAEKLLSLRSLVFEWSQATPPLTEPDPTTNCHCLQAGVSRRQRTPHIYHSYNFNRISQLPGELTSRLACYFQALAAFQNSLTGNRARLEVFEDGPALHPQLIQYPRGGGLFGRHIHPLDPQRIGLIVGLSRRGIDFTSGGTGFAVDDVVTDIGPHHDLGDVALFRFDIPHWVRPADVSEKFDWDSEAGRWSMVLPYY
jgi:hypothetical protein